MPASLLFLSALALALIAARANAASPDDPGAPVRADRYRPVISGTKSYRPVEPLPWGDVNRRVAPAPEKGKDSGAPQRNGPPQSAPQHKH
jgi:hypothetical protein